MPTNIATTPKLFIGMDIHKKSWKLHFATDISVGSTLSFAPNAESLRSYVDKHYEDHEVAIAYECGCCGYTAARDFIDFDWDTYIVNPADIPKPSKMGVVKTDKIDARNIALQLRAGNLKKLIIPTVERECLRNLTRRRTQVIRRVRKIKLQIRSLLLYHSLPIPEEYDNANWSKNFISWLNDFEWNFNTIDSAFGSMLEELKFLDAQLKKLSNDMRRLAKIYNTDDYELLRSVPGIGGLTAAYIISEIGDIRRFNSLKQFASYVGLVPNVYGSGDNVRSYGVNPRGNKTVRSLLVESSWVAIRKDPVLQKYYRKHATNGNGKAAIFKTSRKLLNRIYAVIKTETKYEIGLIE